jgi:hypothetical protein
MPHAKINLHKMPPKHQIPPTLAPCGVFCGACPSFYKSCLGCASNDKKQSRTSKWSCKIRGCCYKTKGLDFCIYCHDYPCKIVQKKLFTSHLEDPRYTYRFEIPQVFVNLKILGLDGYYEFQKTRWQCDTCGGTIKFYIYACDKCNKEKLIEP